MSVIISESNYVKVKVTTKSLPKKKRNVVKTVQKLFNNYLNEYQQHHINLHNKNIVNKVFTMPRNEQKITVQNIL